MAKRLGEFLVEEQILTREQVAEALQVQQLYGGRLGTNLLELGFLGIDALAHTLARLYQLPIATPEDFDAAPPEAIDLIPSELAAAAECFPLREEGRRLHVAFSNPLNVANMDRVAFYTGRTLVPHVAPELRLRFYLERRYGIARPNRHGWLTRPFQQIDRLLPPDGAGSEWRAEAGDATGLLPGELGPPSARGAAHPAGSVSSQMRAAPPVTAPPSPRARPQESPTLPPATATAAVLPRARPEETSARPPAPATAPTPPRARPEEIAALPPAPATAPAPPPARPEETSALPPAPATAVAGPAPDPAGRDEAAVDEAAVDVILLDEEDAPAPMPARPHPVTHAEVLRRVRTAISRDDVDTALVGFLASVASAGFLLQVRRGLAVGWKGFSDRSAGDPVEGLVVRLDGPSAFEHAARTGGRHLGPLAADVPAHRILIEHRGCLPGEALIQPVALGTRTVVLLYADRGPGGRFGPEALEAAEELARVAGRAYERIVLARKAAGLGP